ncbi:MAG: hypothetical protein ACRD8A_15430 [Candidatus Acidiferrales bacterium]
MGRLFIFLKGIHSMATTVIMPETAWTKLAVAERELNAHDAARAPLQKECDALEDALQLAQAKADAVDPMRWTPERAVFYKTRTHVEAKRDELLKHNEKRQDIVTRCEELKREIVAIEQKIGVAEREFGIARDEHGQAENTLRIAREQRHGARIIDAESIFATAQKNLTEKTQALEAAWALRGHPHSVSDTKNGADHLIAKYPILRLRAQNPDFRAVDDSVGRLEKEHDRLLAEILPLEATLTKEQGNPFPISGGPVSRVLAEIYPEMRTLEARGADASAVKFQRLRQMSELLASLREKFERVEADRAAATKRRDEMFAQFEAGR